FLPFAALLKGAPTFQDEAGDIPSRYGCPFQPRCVVRRAHYDVSRDGAFSTVTRVPRDRWARLTGSLHFPHRQLILAISSEAKALRGYWETLIQGDSHLALSLRGVRIRH